MALRQNGRGIVAILKRAMFCGRSVCFLSGWPVPKVKLDFRHQFLTQFSFCLITRLYSFGSVWQDNDKSRDFEMAEITILI